MRPKKITVVGVGASVWIPLDYRQAPFHVGLGAVVVSGTATYTVQHTFDDIYDLTVVPVSYDNAGLTAVTANKDGNYAFPVRAIRLNVTGGISPVVSLNILQGTR